MQLIRISVSLNRNHRPVAGEGLVYLVWDYAIGFLANPEHTKAKITGTDPRPKLSNGHPIFKSNLH
jgi:hypothetical protein